MARRAKQPAADSGGIDVPKGTFRRAQPSGRLFAPSGAKGILVTTIPAKATLSAPRKRLLELLADLNFGRVEGLTVRRGEPVFHPPPRVVREVKFGGDNGPRPERDANDFLLKAQAVELFRHLDRLDDGTVQSIEVKHGLPFRMLVADAVI